MADAPVDRTSDRSNPLNAERVSAFWLLTDGGLVVVDEAEEDLKLRDVRAENLRVARELWAADPNSCARIVRAAARAYETFIRMCGEAARSTRFYNLYATYPLAHRGRESYGERSSITQFCAAGERSVRVRDIKTAHALLATLEPLYRAHFDLVLHDRGTATLKESVRRLGAEWLVAQDRLELQISTEITYNWVARLLVRLTMLLFSMY